MEQKPITRHAMGMQVELGTLFDARSSTFYSSYSLWDLEVIKKHQRTIEAPHTKYFFSSSLKDTRKNSGLDVEGSVAVDFGIFELSGSAKYLEDKQRNSNEARVDVTCTRVNRTRAIPMEVMTKMKYNELILSSPEITHFVSEVKEGAVGNITFIKRCKSSDEVKKISGSLSGALKKSMAIDLKGDVCLDWKEGEKESYEDIQIIVEGAITEAVTNVEDAARVGKELPATLSGITNTLTMTLLPISKLDSKVKRLVRKLDEDLLMKVSNMLTKAKIASAEVSELQELPHMEMFPKIKEQCLSFQEAFDHYIASFRQMVGETLPRLKDGSQEENVFMRKLVSVLAIMRQHVIIAKKFLSIKNDEGQVLGNTMENLEGQGLRNYLKESGAYIAGNEREQVMLNLYVPQSRHHHLEKQLAEVSQKSDGTDSDDTDSDEEVEWFDDDQSKLHNACAQILESYKKNGSNAKVEFGFCSVSKAYSVDGSKRIKTCIGDVILKSKGKVQVCEPNLEKALSHLVVTIDELKQKRAKVFFDFSAENTSLGRVVVKLHYDDAPETCCKFLRLVTNEPGWGYKGSEVKKTMEMVFGNVGFNSYIRVGEGLMSMAKSDGHSTEGLLTSPENLKSTHNRGTVSMSIFCPCGVKRDAKDGKTRADFWIFSEPHTSFDGHYQIVGHVTNESLTVVDAVVECYNTGYYPGPPKTITIIDCGVL